MAVALPLPTYISQASTRTRAHKTKSAMFGDGYSQDMPDGIHSNRDSYDLVYENLTKTERDTLWAALDAAGGWDVITWAPDVGGPTKRWKLADDAKESYPSGLHYTISFTLRQVP